MMMDLRYHLASLMSIFLALAVGIVVGISLGSSERQAATIQNLQRDVAAIRAEDTHIKEVNAEMRRLLAARDDAQAELLPLAVHGRLAGNRVALLLTGDSAALIAPVIRALRLAGAEVPVTVRLPRGSWGSDPASAVGRDASRDKSGSSSGAPQVGADRSRSLPDASHDAREVAAAVTRALLQGRSDLLEGARAREPELDVTGDLRVPFRRLLLLCPNDEPSYAAQIAAGRGIEAAVGAAARDAEALLVAAEPEGEHPTMTSTATAPPRDTLSLLPALAAMGASTIDNVDTATGQIAMVLALAGTRGNFGTGPRASRPLPPITPP